MCNENRQWNFRLYCLFLLVVSLCFGSRNAFPIAPARIVCNSKLSEGFKRSFQMNIEYISFVMYIKFLAVNLEHSEKLIDIRKLLL